MLSETDLHPTTTHASFHLVGKGAAAGVAHERLFARVPPHVRLQIALFVRQQQHRMSR